ncbi:KPN_02809 family neutral zinc metallopeptidase [Cellvibrio polysaccharolyticus]|uniref:Neutral zinc metallopeptidase n=1 Tax=Cellvibrio polysaccharolyticus TaxID=2082724 RepID=A0A928V3E1_9GAMM|nr:neutral zinc metallopeptidase [Cellvibrio polysaccharolyticus]MBE8715899.1 hypothetical protein [Cellvibrio polysaccharolyticus]
MRWKDGRRSKNVEDNRGQGPQSFGGGGGSPLLQLLPLLLSGRLGKAGFIVVIVILAFSYFGGGNTGSGVSDQQGGSYTTSAEDDQLADFMAVVLGDTEETWHNLFQQQNLAYEEPRLRLFTGAVQSTCGHAQAAMGPFYCSGDKRVYIDLAFFKDLRDRYNAAGDFAQAYVLAHEVGHHVQHLLGTLDKVHRQQTSLNKSQANALSVKLELQADCYAGIWAHHADRSRQLLDDGDIEEALRAAAAIGDDRLQQQSRGYVTPESFTHGTSEQRMHWFTTGKKHGTLAACDTFR